MIACPCCNQALPDQSTPEFLRFEHQFRNQDRQLIGALIDAYPNGIPMERLVDALYGGRSDGGATSAENVVRCRLTFIRGVVEKYGWRVPHTNEWYGLYRIERMEQQQSKRSA